MGKSLIEISFELKRKLDEAMELDISGEEMAEKLNQELAEKADNVAMYRRSIQDHLDSINALMDELKERKRVWENKLARMDDYIQNSMRLLDVNSIEGTYFKIANRKPAQVVEVYDERLIPQEFIEVPEPEPRVMKKEIKEALKQGEIIQGVRLVDGKKSLMVKIK